MGESVSLFAKRAEELLTYFGRRDIVALKQLGGDAAEDAFAFHVPCMVNVSIVAYALGKFLEKPYLLHNPSWKDFESQAKNELGQSLALMRQQQVGRACDSFGRLIKEIDGLSRDLGRFAIGAVEKARIKAATQIYAHGASLGKAAEMTGANKQELSRYIGATRIADKYNTLSVSQRLENAKSIFG